MQIRNLGTSGLRVSVVGLGCNNFGARLDLEGSRKVIHKALDCGITLFDTADIYGDRGGSETHMGQILGNRRKDIVLATKFAMPMDTEEKLKGASRRYIVSAVEASLTRLKTDWIDLYQQHRPDPLTPFDETARALDDLVRSGKVRYVGCSNLQGWQVATAQMTAKAAGLNPFISAQDELSLLVRKNEKELLPALVHHGLGLLPFFPLACGMLTGKYKRNATMPAGARLTTTERHQATYMTDRNWGVVEKLTDFAEGRGHTLLELAFSWLACKPPVASVIAGATKPEQVEANVEAANWALTVEEMAEIEKIAGV
jgi:aryl-alcohol dehydrogenase-like predicted oxidoreductase